MSLPREESVAYHAARLLLILRHCGSPQKSVGRAPGIRSRTLLAKLDFFVRYPLYLEKALAIRAPELRRHVKLVAAGPEGSSVESTMVKYFFGPWDHIYYNVLAYLVGKGFVRVELERGVEIFRLTPLGLDVAARIGEEPAYVPLVERAGVVGTVFVGFVGTRLADFIYTNFPEVVNRKLGATI